MARLETSFTPKQIGLLEALWATETEAKVTRRFDNGDGTYRFENVVRRTHPIDFPVHPGEFALKLHEKRPGAPLSEYFVNLRELPGGLLVSVAESIAEVTPVTQIDICAGIPSAGDPIAQEYSKVTGIPSFQIFGKAETGSGRKIVAAPDAPRGDGMRLEILDDLITEADTKFEAIEVASKLGYKIVGVGVLVDRQQGGTEQLMAKGYSVHAALLISKAFEYYYKRQKIDWDRYVKSMGYLNDARHSVGLAPING